jgi:hypothetical protein
MTNEMMNKWLVRLSLALLAAVAIAAHATAQGVPQGVRGSGPPSVTIIQVVELSNAGQQRRFEAQWTTQKPELTTILKHAVTLDVKFTGGVNQTASQKLGATAASAIFSFSGVPANARALDFKASIQTTFTTPESSSISTTREFNLNTDSFQGGVGSGGALPPDRPLVQIASATAINLSSIEARWNVQAPPGVNIERFGVSGLVTYEFKQAGVTPVTRQSQVSIAIGSQRQSRVVINDPPQRGGPFASRIRVTLETAFNKLVERTIQTNKEGRF